MKVMKILYLIFTLLISISLSAQKIDTVKVQILVSYDRYSKKYQKSEYIYAYEIRQTNICPECVYPSYDKIGFLTIDKEPVPYEWLIWSWIDKTDLNCSQRENKPPYH